jgi:UDP-2,3-diacylglucosamine hydrolase
MKNSPFIFVADAHLRGPSDPNQKQWIRFLSRLQPSPDRLVILGDLFDFLAGSNRAAATAYHDVLSLLKNWGPFHYIEGNHDFDLSNETPGFKQAHFHRRPTILNIGGISCLLRHGDRLDPKDTGSRLLRRTLQSGFVRFLRDHLLPDAWVFRAGMKVSLMSRSRHQRLRERENNLLPTLAMQDLHNNGVQAVLFAHTHQALLRSVPGGIIANPGASILNGSYLQLEERTWTLRKFPDGDILSPGPIMIT